MAGLRRVPQVELERFAHQEYVKAYASAPKPKLRNLLALTEFCVPRIIPWAGVSYRAPPLGFRDGVRLMVAANALQDLRLAGVAPPARREAARVALLCLRSVLRGPWYRRRFRSTDPAEVEAVAWLVLHVPDEGVLPPAKGSATLDYMDTLAAFARDLPAWCGPDGLPLSWAHYQYGLHHLTRARHREDLRHAISVRAAGAEVKAFKEFENEWRAAAGWN